MSEYSDDVSRDRAVFRLRLRQQRDARIGIHPEREEGLVFLSRVRRVAQDKQRALARPT
jgi:hypothetical protein